MARLHNGVFGYNSYAASMPTFAAPDDGAAGAPFAMFQPLSVFDGSTFVVSGPKDAGFNVSSVVGNGCGCACCESDGKPIFYMDEAADGTIIIPSEIASSTPANTSTTESLTLGQIRTEEIDFAGDRDWYSITLTEGQTYEFKMNKFASAVDSIISVFDANGDLLTYDDDGGTADNGLVTFTAGSTGTYYIEADAAGSGTGRYTIVANERANDSIANGPGTDATYTLNGTATGEIDYSGDQDWFAVTMQAGETYEIILTADGTGNTLGDGYLTFHDANGILLAFDDDGGPNLGSRIVWTPEETGTYYIAAQGFSGNDTASVGTYTLTSGPSDPLSPLEALDWGTQLSDTNVTIYFAGAGEDSGSNNGEGEDYISDGWSQAEMNAVMDALSTFSDVSNLTFTITTNSANADFRLFIDDFEADTDDDNDSTLGFFAPPGFSNSGNGVFNSEGLGWSTNGLKQGGFGYITLIHEFGHGFGLSHPHDGGGTSSVMTGVTGSNDTGALDLNQGVYTTMSYVDGWQTSPYGTSGTTAFGWQGTPMAFDVALIQQKYGASSFNTGDTVYTVNSSNGSGTFWQSIWDTGGTDTLQYSGSADSVLDLREATLGYTDGGGGFLSYANGIFGGYTIANGVDIENAIGGSGNDVITGNDLANVLQGGGGNDTIDGGGGIDTAVFSGASNEYTITQTSATTYTITHNGNGADGTDTVTGVENAQFSDRTVELDTAPTFTEQSDTFTGTDMDDVFASLGGNDILDGAGGNDRIDAGDGADQVSGGTGNDTLLGGESVALSGTQAQVYRLYQATLDREPDAAGLEGWQNVLDGGQQSLLQVIDGFVASNEFQSTYGALDNTAFVELLYTNVLDRASDPAGLQGWLDFIDGGGTRAQVVRGFSESAEFISNTEFAGQAWATNNQFGEIEGQVYRLYQATLDRAPDAAGFQGWVGLIEGGRDYIDIIPGFVNSSEFQATYGSLDDTEFVTLLYNNVLGRDPDAGGLQGWLNVLEGGGSRASVVRGFSESGEFVRGSADGLVSFMQNVNTSWNDTLIGEQGNDILFGGRGADTFIFDAAQGGSDTVYGLEDWDIIQMNGFGYNSAAEFAAQLTQDGSDVRFSDQGSLIVFDNTDIATVTGLFDG